MIENTEPSVNEAPAHVQEQLDASRRQFIQKWLDEITADKVHWGPRFDEMRENMTLARLGADGDWVKNDNYTVPLIKRHINQKTAALYARSPKAYAKRRERLEYSLWDGSPETLQAAMMASMPPVDPATGVTQADPLTGQPVGGDPNAQAMLQEVYQVKERNQLYERVGKTLAYLFNYYIGECNPDFKRQMKRVIRRALVCKVAYVELDFQKTFERPADVTSRIYDEQERLNRFEALSEDLMAGGGEVDDSAIEEIRQTLKVLQETPEVLVREGLTFDFPRSTSIIPDRKTTVLEGFIGAGHVTREYQLTADEIKETYKVDVTKYAEVNPENEPKKNVKTENGGKVWGGHGKSDDANKGKAKYNVWKVWDKKTGQTFVLCEGYCEGYLREPSQPVFVEGFWPIFALTFNADESEEDPFPVSDVEDLKWPQQEYNSARQGAREHRIVNRPRFFTGKGILEDAEKKRLQSSRAFEVIELSVVDLQTPAEKLIQVFKGAPYDEALYRTTDAVQDILLGSGTQQANIGGTAGDSATESSIAENSRQASLTSNTDDLDDFLSTLAQGAGQVMLTEMDEMTVKKIVGPGAVWPSFSRMEAVEELYLQVRAGSSGRPNKAAELANLERAGPILVQLGGVSPKPLVRKFAEILDIDVEEFYVEGLPSIVAQNAMAGKQTQPGGNPESDPNAQGEEGGQNQKGPGRNERPQGPQPGYAPPAPMPGAPPAA